MKRVKLATVGGKEAWLDPEHVSHLSPSGLPGCTVLHQPGAPFFLVVLGDVADVKMALWPEGGDAA